MGTEVLKAFSSKPGGLEILTSGEGMLAACKTCGPLLDDRGLDCGARVGGGCWPAHRRGGAATGERAIQYVHSDDASMGHRPM